MLDQNSDGGDSSEEQKSLKKQNLLLTLGMVGAFLSTGEFSDAEEVGGSLLVDRGVSIGSYLSGGDSLPRLHVGGGGLVAMRDCV